MNVYKIILFVLYGLSTLVSISQIGKTPKTRTPADAVAGLVFTGVFVTLVVLA